ncbi:unnamed protein product [Caenorhabditis angaria]|uniref:Uncharacterized protein n=1 Tax=Caenorhabditis angaria TaxID=860376 RepID=A0A9P1I0Y6_9PELO|nr:unnamed protein product [Caenorhabditis angaria]
MLESEEILQLRADLEKMRRMLKNKDDMIEEMELEISNLSKNSNNVTNDCGKEKEWNEQIRKLHLEVEDKATIVAQKDLLVSNLEKEVERLECSNRELVNRDLDDETFHTNANIENELAKVKDENSQLHEILDKLVEEHETTKKDLAQLREEYEAASEHIKTLEYDFNQCREEKERIESELFAYQNGNMKMAKRGNSIFTEAMDAERRLESELKVLYAENQKLKAAVKRLEEEKEEAEMMAIGEIRIQSQLCSSNDYYELVQIRQKNADYESEKLILWTKFFEKAKNASTKDIGLLVKGYIDGFKCSIGKMKENYQETLKANQELHCTIRNLKIELEAKEVHIQRLKSEANIANRKTCIENVLKSADILNRRPTVNILKHATSSDEKPGIENVAGNSTILNDSLQPDIPKATPKKDEVSDWAKNLLAKREAAKKASVKKEISFARPQMAESNPIFKSSRLAHLSNAAENK